VREAYDYGASAPQTLVEGVGAPRDPAAPAPYPSLIRSDIEPPPQSEDCLFLNVWTPSTTGKRPVMFWLHGGGFSTGSGSSAWYDGTNLAKKQDVVVVTINHRLNVFGFADLSAYGERYAASSSVGMADCVLALQWVRDNIERFGGDPPTDATIDPIDRDMFDCLVHTKPEWWNLIADDDYKLPKPWTMISETCDVQVNTEAKLCVVSREEIRPNEFIVKFAGCSHEISLRALVDWMLSSNDTLVRCPECNQDQTAPSMNIADPSKIVHVRPELQTFWNTCDPHDSLFANTWSFEFGEELFHVTTEFVEV